MKIVDFPESNTVYGADQPEYSPLPAHRAEDGAVTSCWKMTLKERLKVLFTGKIYLQLLTFNNPIQPQLMSINNLAIEDNGRVET